MTVNICWQYRIKKRFQEENTDFSAKPITGDIKVLPIDWRTAKDFIVQYEWLGNMGNSKYCFGLFQGESLASVVCYGPSVAPSRYKNLLGEDLSKSILQLCRGASSYWAPNWASSKLVSSSLRILKRTTNTRIVIAYADPDAGEVGTIYQACNAYYIGKTSPGGGKKYTIKGHTYDPRKVVSKFGSRAHKYLMTVDPYYTTTPIKPKHRYIFVLGNNPERKRILELISHLVESYPKRSDSVNTLIGEKDLT